MDCPVCGTDIRMDHEAFETVKNERNVIDLHCDTKEAVNESIGLLNCMLDNGEYHSAHSKKIVNDALAILRRLE